MNIVEKAVVDLGFEVEYITFSDEIWTRSREIFLSIAANALSPPIIEEMDREGEELIPALNGTKLIL
jgi:hypothetical protein